MPLAPPLPETHTRERTPPEPPRIRVCLNDGGHPLVAAALAAVLRGSAGMTVGRDSDGVAPAARPGGPETVRLLFRPTERALRRIAGSPFRRPTVVCVRANPSSFRLDTALGVDPYSVVTTDDPPEALIRGVHSAAARMPHVGPSLERRLQVLDGRLRLVCRDGVLSLTDRQIDILRLLASGHSIRESAAALGVTPKTVESHRFRIGRRLGLTDRVELTRFAIREGLATP